MLLGGCSNKAEGLVVPVDVNHVTTLPEVSKVDVPDDENLFIVEDLWNSRLTWKFAALKCNMVIDRVNLWRASVVDNHE